MSFVKFEVNVAHPRNVGEDGRGGDGRSEG